MALETFRIEGVGVVSQINSDDLSSAGETLVLINSPTANDHTTTDNRDVEGTALVWTQPQPRIEVYYMLINSPAAGTIELRSGSSNFISCNFAEAGFKELGETPKPGISSPIFVCDIGDSFIVDGTGGQNIYAQYRIVTPKN